MELICEATGKTGQVRLYKNRIEITRKGFTAFALHGFDGTKTIFLSKISGIQFKEVGKVTAGFIQFIVIGSQESKGGLFDATKDENSVTFDVNSQPDFEKIKEYLLNNLS